ncbi:uncharacterized protein LACBIDRAFT_307487 [Laccaria bicolor S238N-H82]|uniref:Predicted protein n=1 Tax=Laccaria bicolor (strain S238N-H82 / ATCC MYA-4686) TaxID=486041 RepID=B0DQ92_LACBS|nr:uncharacterized protein LACBIDRAFT_307487 [Laccaria bicolor S238N-H82]EDR03255.1 predicted protein [Laccaria bicolor S238N-H82]|eukprot:XP_001886051.1 predicted protein [Laccaria bicolor S238N-H82]
MSSQQAFDPTFASIVEISSYMQPWPILYENHPLAQFHAKFWGKNMADEEKQWLDAQKASPATGSEFGLRNQVGEDAVVNEKMVVDVTMDEATTMDPDDDIIPGCYMLDIGIDGLISKLWIRAEYIRVFNSVNAHYDEPSFVGKAPCAVVTGQPGIGKSVWVYYALRRCFAERRPVIWYFKQRCHLFVEEGVYEMPNDFQRAELKSFIWTFVDSDEDSVGIPDYLVPRGTPLFVIFSTSPRRARWSRLHKTVMAPLVAIMNPWKRKEILRAASIYPLGRINESRTNEIFDQLGPTPRLCIEYQLDPNALSLYEKDICTALSKVTSKDLELLLVAAGNGGLGIDSMFDTIALLTRQSLDDAYSPGMATPITPYIQSRLSYQFRNLERKELLRLYKTFAKVREGRKMAGVFFEALAQRNLQEGITLEVVPMVKLDEARNGVPQWCSRHVSTINSKPEEQRMVALNIDIDPIRTEEFAENKRLSLARDVMYVPEADNKVALNSFIWLNEGLFIFQFTTAEAHGLLDFFKEYVDPFPSSCKILFIVGPKQQLTCPQPRNATLRELDMYSAVVDVEAEISYW